MSSSTSALPSLVSIPDAAHQLGVGRSTMYRLLDEGEVATVKIGRRRLVVASSVEALVKRLTQR